MQLAKSYKVQKKLFLSTKINEFIKIANTFIFPALTSNKLSIFSTTWNVGGCKVPNSYNNWLNKDHDLYVICLEECNKTEQWSSTILSYLANHINHKDDDINPYVIVSSVRLWEIVIFIIIKRQYTPFISHIEGTTVACGAGGLAGNKGGVIVSMQLFESKLCFVGCHLAARAERLLQRNENILKIIKSYRPSYIHDNTNDDIINYFHHIIWLGDLNYRINNEWEDVIQLINDNKFGQLLLKDQFLHERNNMNILPGFRESLINWKPTYRLNRLNDSWSNKRRQPPSYTDRILWHSKSAYEYDLQNISYQSCPKMYGSDHRPVNAIFQLSLRKSYTGTLYISPTIKPKYPLQIEIHDIQVILRNSSTMEHLYLKFHNPIYLNPNETICQHKSPYVAKSSTTNNIYNLPLDQRPLAILPYIYNRYYLQYQCLSVDLYLNKECSNLLATGHISLYHAFQQPGTIAYNSKSIISIDGSVIAELKASIYFNLNEHFIEYETKEEASNSSSTFYTTINPTNHILPDYDNLSTNAYERALQEEKQAQEIEQGLEQLKLKAKLALSSLNDVDRNNKHNNKHLFMSLKKL